MVGAIMKRFIYIILAGAIGGCAMQADKDSSVPDTMEETRAAEAGSFLGKGITIGSGRDRDGDENAKIGVNSYLWQASLDALADLPIVTADSNGGIIITDWHSTTSATNERLKVNINILGKKLTPGNLRVRVFRQTKKDGTWLSAPVSPITSRNMEDAILRKARKLRIAALGG